MTTIDPTQPPQVSQDALENIEPYEDAGEPVDATDGDDAGQQPERRETREARYRRQLREVEAERDQLRDLVRELQENEAVRLAGELLAVPEDFIVWGGMADALDPDTGRVDPERVRAVCESLIASRSYMARPQRRVDFGQGARGGPTPSSASWQQVLRQGRQ